MHPTLGLLLLRLLPAVLSRLKRWHLPPIRLIASEQTRLQFLKQRRQLTTLVHNALIVAGVEEDLFLTSRITVTALALGKRHSRRFA